MYKLTEILNPEILKYRSKHYRLENDVRNLDRVIAVDAHEAVIFYCARILEVLLRDAYGLLLDYGRPKKTVEMAAFLSKYNLLPKTTLYWTTGLRLLGNDVRHIKRRISKEEAQLSLLFLEFYLKWYFCDFQLNKIKQPTIYRQSRSLTSTTNPRIIDLTWDLEKKNFNPDSLAVVFGRHAEDFVNEFSKNPTYPILLIDIFLALGDHPSAKRMIDLVDSKNNGNQQRYTELKGLYFSRTGDLDGALEVLEDYYETYKDYNYFDDGEMSGILGGVYKKKWERSEDKSDLAKSHKTYYEGWKRDSREQNAYLGINAASTSFWLGQTEKCKKIAKQVKSCLEERKLLIEEKTNCQRGLNYWDQVSLAEANLLLNAKEVARNIYKDAFEMHKKCKEEIKVTKKQIEKILKKMDSEETLSQFLL